MSRDKKQPGAVGLYSLSVYTIRASSDLDAAWLSQRSRVFEEGKAWAKAEELLGRAKADGQSVPLLFAFAEDVNPIRYVAELMDVAIRKVGERKWTTKYRFRNLRCLPAPLWHSELVVASTGKPMRDDFIRPYAVCQTPQRLLEWDGVRF